jgi:hypothetical protein
MDESAALAWAVEFFRSRAADMTLEGSERRGIELAVNTLLSGFYYEAEQHPEDVDSRTAKFISKMRDRGAEYLVAHLAAALMERGNRLPKPMQDFVIDFLRNPKVEKRDRGPQKRTRIMRDMLIGAAVGIIVQEYGFPPTRNRATRHPCAASIVLDALHKTIKLSISEAEVVRVWSLYRKKVMGGGAIHLGDGLIVAKRPS